MNNEQQQAYSEKLRLLLGRSIDSTKTEFQRIEGEQNAKGMLRSGNTIKKFMDCIHSTNANLYKAALDAAKSYSLDYSTELENLILTEVEKIQEQYSQEFTDDFKKRCVTFGRKGLFGSIESQYTGELNTNRAEFQSDLRHYIIELKSDKTLSKKQKILMGIEGAILLAMTFLAGMWFKDPSGNYEPLIAIGGLLIPAIAIASKLKGSKT